MGTYLYIGSVDIRIKKERLPELLAGLVAKLRDPDAGEMLAPDAEAPADLAAAFEFWRFSPEFDDAGDLTGLDFNGEKQGDDEDYLMQVLSRFAEDGGEVYASNSEDSHWVWRFQGGEMRVYYGELVYGHECFTCNEAKGKKQYTICEGCMELPEKIFRAKLFAKKIKRGS